MPTSPPLAPSTVAGVSPTPLSLHLLWRPGIGMAAYYVDAPQPAADVEMPGPLAAILDGKRFRREIPIQDPSGRRRFVAAATLGVGTTVMLLDASRSVPVAGDLRWYRYILDGVRRFVSAAAVAPALREVAGEWVMRWQPIPTPAWRSWAAVVTESAPPALLDNGGRDALLDFAAELVDHETRSRITLSTSRFGVPAPQAPAVAALFGVPTSATPGPPARMAAATTAWTAWNTGGIRDDHALLFRLFEPEYGEPDDDSFSSDWWAADGPAAPADHDAARWRLQVCRRSIDGHVEPVAPHRLDAHDLDAVTTGLAAAVRAFDQLAAADADRTSLDFLLPTPLAADLFATGAAALAEAGFPVLLPRTIAEVRPGLGLRATPVTGGGAPATMVGLREVREFEWRLALGEGPDATTLSDDDLAELARQKGDLVRLRGAWVHAEGAALSRAAAFVLARRGLPDAQQLPTDMGELFGLLTDATAHLPVPVTSVEGLSWLDEIATHGHLRPPSLPAPRDLDATLRPYQQRGMEWLARLAELGIGGVLADDMGLGKTIQIIALECHERQHAPSAPTLIVCPMSVVGNWAREIERFAPGLRVCIHHGPRRVVGASFADGLADVDIVLTTFATAARDRDLLADRSWRRVVVDEAQHLKNVNTIAAKAVRALTAAHRVALTGTPVENRLEDLRAVVDLVNPGLLGSPSVFRARYAEPIERDRDPHALRRLSGLTRPFILRREKGDPTIAVDLPQRADITVRANLTVEQAALYRAVIDELMNALRDKQQRTLRRRNVLAALTRLKQICNHPVHYLADGSALTHQGEHRSGKVELLTDVLTTLHEEGDRALVFTQFAALGDLLLPWLGEALGTDIPMLHGGLSRHERDRLVERFQADTGPPVLLATLKAGGTGLNLTAANHVVHFDRWWNPAVEDQATDRAYRIGQHQHVTVRRFVCVGTIEERIDDMIRRKRELSRLTVAAGENWVADLGNDELFELLRLRDEAVSE